MTDDQPEPGRHAGGADEPTQPVAPASPDPDAGTSGRSDGPSDTGWLPPVTQAPPHSSPPESGGQWQQPSPYQRPYGQPHGQSSYGQSQGQPQTQPYAQPYGQSYPVPPTHREAQRSSRVPGWLWPVVTALALLLGLIGGAIAGIAVDGLNEGSSSGGLLESGPVDSPPLKAENGSVAKVAAELLPSTVQVIAEYDGKAQGATGSGFVLDQRGHVVTNNHVVEQAAQDDGPIEVVDRDGRHFEATVVGRSAVYDLAVLDVKGSPGLPPASLGASRALHVGEPVVAFGSPLGLSSTVTSGIVSALNRPVTTGETLDGDNSYINAVQTDAAINPGNSGGPLVNLRGQVVGVNSAIATTGGGSFGGGESGNIGVGFAIPIEQVRITADQILRDGEARYPVIGAKVDVRDSNGRGATISEVMSGTPAERAGLQKGDVVTAVDGLHVTDGIALIVAIRTHRPGETVTFTVQRAGDERQVDVTLDSEVG